MTLQEVYRQVAEQLAAVPFGALYPGFHPYRFALYDSRQVCLDGSLLPCQSSFRGNTSIVFEGRLLAIWNYELSPVADMDRLAYLLVHEMFHCFQHENGESRFPSDLTLLNYPGDLTNYAQKYCENGCLAHAYAAHDLLSFQTFAAIRNQRAARYPAMVRQECRAETIEGLAEAVGLRALRALAPEKFAQTVQEYQDDLTRKSPLLFDIRRISYYSGALFFLCMERFQLPFPSSLAAELTPYEQTLLSAKGIAPAVEVYPFLPREYQRLCAEKETAIRRYLDAAVYTACPASICGYDPMNMERWEQFLYCKSFVRLKNGERTFAFYEPVVLVLDKGSDSEITGYYKNTANGSPPLL